MLPSPPYQDLLRAVGSLLDREGRREAAEAVKALRKPPVGAWVVNRLAREQPDRLGALLHAVDDVRRAHAGSPDDLRAASAAEHQALDALVRSAGSVLREAGQAASEATLLRVRRTLEAGAADPGKRSC